MTLDIIISLLAEIIRVPEEYMNGKTPLTSEYDIEPLDIAKLIIEIEKRFDLLIYDEDVHTFKTLHDVAQYVDARLGE